MSDRIRDMVGKAVSEEEVAVALGFKDVFELRRWQTEQGHKVVELEANLREVQGDARNFLYSGKRMMSVLEKVKEVLERGPLPSLEERKLMLMAIEVVCGRGVDWKKELEGWVDLSGK